MMIPAVYRFEVTLDKDQIERYNRWRSNLPHTPERSIVNWVSRPFGDDAMMRSYYDQESNTVVVYTGNEVINEVNEYLILGEPVLRNRAPKDNRYTSTIQYLNNDNQIM